MLAVVRLQVLTGPHRGATYCFPDRTNCTIGRSKECLVQFTGHEQDNLVSRRHCLLHIDLPRVQARDLGSRNGTYLNGKPIHCEAGPGEECGPSCAANVQDGDLLTLGGMTMRVELVACPRLAGSGEEAPSWDTGALVMQDCRFPCHDHTTARADNAAITLV